ncbi:(2Fe-2S) ferredoxin domain-containing protein [Phormidium sp. LEGE 05292]|uniref:(2Fe-2S) ferredoxin domain-containing protein n=1 Tax=[Phormidium] sp. LEGE 05292 TaxID=767427 RepID=UPI00187F8823|nr:(2Fe-2S) ferredoxin domain-containing protein [Phormidium sp. LEGE 05292]MBE9225563.1 (2Fe-2S) ferredoxin domain-containing protein [Phormidium sp. LEGE 05292]
MGKKTCQVTEFCLAGKFVGFVLEDGYKIKLLRVETAEGESWIKLSKEARAGLGQVLLPGDWIEVWGERKLDAEKGAAKLKAYRIKLKASAQTQVVPQETQALQPKKKPACILVCQKSDCCKRGAMEVSQALAEGLRDRNLQQEVIIKGTGCMKHCKAGPNIVMPDKTAYRRIDASEVPEILDKHFVTENQSKDAVPVFASVV